MTIRSMQRSSECGFLFKYQNWWFVAVSVRRIHPDEYTYKDDSRPWEMEAKLKNKSTAGEREKGYWW